MLKIKFSPGEVGEGAAAYSFLRCLGGCVFFLLFEWGRHPAQTAKKTRTRPNSKNKNTRTAQTTKKTRQHKNEHSYRLQNKGFGWREKGLGIRDWG